MKTPRIVGTPAEVAIGAGSLQSGTLRAVAGSPKAKGFRLIATAACRYLIGSDPTAVATSVYLPANWVEYVTLNQNEKVAVIQEAGAGKLSVTAVDL